MPTAKRYERDLRKRRKKIKPNKRTVTLELTPEELELCANGLDAHVYWDLCSDELNAKHSGEILIEKIEDAETREQVRKIRALESILLKAAHRISKESGK